MRVDRLSHDWFQQRTLFRRKEPLWITAVLRVLRGSSRGAINQPTVAWWLPRRTAAWPGPRFVPVSRSARWTTENTKDHGDPRRQ